ncbi:NAD(P)/FAD-dependent oxidoreductase [Ruminococcus sp. Marseille-P6503]|uniref:NAD(P)/FAD-dependent oxidoreductase n=1 Tax=Ruminococcus sp. Marseille-P6503 TaxID=2364796 RepID=UPI000F5277E3|nr:NAD(P)/FAD-dependent oxidoreductase [Ruminococcus sp. Marseille-P6503]
MKNVVIIGAGPAGITAAAELLKDGSEYNVTVLEESDEIGGISRTVRYSGNRMDIGGHRFFSKSDEVMNWWSSLMPVQGADAYDDKVLGREKPLEADGPDPENEDVVMLVRDRVSRIYYNKHFFDYPISMKPETIKNMGFATTVRAGFSYLKSCIFKKPETNLENFYINRFGKVLYSMFFEGYTEKLWGRHPSEISADWGAQRVKGLSVRAIIKDMLAKVLGRNKDSKEVETSLIEQFWYPKYGPGQLWELAAQKVREGGGTVLMNHKVKRVVCGEGKIEAVYCDTPDGEKKIEADIFISSMPVKDLINDMEGDGPCEKIRKIAEGLPYRDFVTVGLLVNRLNLKNHTGKKTLGNIVPDCWIYVQDKGVKLGRIQIFNNWSPYMVKDPENTVWIGLEYFCAEGDSFWNMTDEECIAFAIGELEKMGVIDSREVLDSHRERVKKAYPAYFDTYKHFDRMISYLNTFDNLYCIGRNGQHRYNNMDHSMLTAIYAARSIKAGNSDKTPIWNVNTEKEYHEQKSE